MSDPLHVKYRPQSLDEVVGHKDVVDSLNDVLSRDNHTRSFLFCGPSGVGKTTLARIIATRVGAENDGIVEVDAATHSGVDAIRQVTQSIYYHPLGSESRMIIIDECHALSSQAWQSLLKSIEEPPPGVYFALCTTLAAKVPNTIRTRCHAVTLKDVAARAMEPWLRHTAKRESFDLVDGAVEAIARAAKGSPRQALQFLSIGEGAKDLDDLKARMDQAVDSRGGIDLARMLVSRSKPPWKNVAALVKELKDENPEGVRITVSRYVAAVMLGATTYQEAMRHHRTLDAFSVPVTGIDGIVLACANALID